MTTNMLQLSSIGEVSSIFHRYSEKFPEEIVCISDEIRNIANQIQNIFNKDLKSIRKLVNEKRVRICINYKDFENDEYLLSTALYLESDIPKTQGQLIRFYLSNLYICKNVMISIIDYISSFLMNQMKKALESYKNKENNYLFKVFYEFIGYCKNIDSISNIYNIFLKELKIQVDNKKNQQRSIYLSLPDRNNIREGIRECLLTKNSQYISFPLIRIAMEFAISQDMGIKIQQKLDEVEIKVNDIFFTHEINLNEMLSLLGKMGIVKNSTLNTLKNIYEWGNRSIHKGQHLPLSLIWYSLWYLERDLKNLLFNPSKLSSKENLDLFNKLKQEDKIKIIDDKTTFIPSLYNFYSI